jgi:CheY-like chemotaxis protein
MKSDRNLKILLVEDDTIAQIVAKSNLSELNCELDIASNGQEALDLTLQKVYDLIFMDIGLEDMDGYTVTKKIRKQNGKNDHTIVIAVTAHSKDTIEKNCLEAGINYIVNKPLTMDVANHILSKFIK